MEWTDSEIQRDIFGDELDIQSRSTVQIFRDGSDFVTQHHTSEAQRKNKFPQELSITPLA